MNDSLMPVIETLDALQRYQRGVSPERIAKSMSPEARDLIGLPPVAADSNTLHGLASIARHHGQRPLSRTAPLAKAVGTKRRQSAGEQQRDKGEAKFTRDMTELAIVQGNLSATRGSHTAARWRDDRQRAVKVYRALRAELAQMPGKVPAAVVSALESRLNFIGARLAAMNLI